MLRHYLNTIPCGYEEFCKDRNYIDKTGLIQFVNAQIDKKGKLILASWPRRFGKTYTAQMLNAYYSIGYDTHALFKEKKIAGQNPSLAYCGAFDVIYMDMLDFRARATGKQSSLNKASKNGERARQLDWIDYLSDSIIEEITDVYGKDVAADTLADTLVNTVQKTGRKFFWICDEWDNIFREPADDEKAPEKYIELLRSLFKVPQITSFVFAAAYMTGILPMIKMEGESALTEFDNYTMFVPGDLAPYIGFTEEEVRQLLERNPECSISYEQLAEWYEGYAFPGAGPLFNPRSVIHAIKFRKCTSYWTNSASNAQFKQLIALKRDVLRRDVETLLQGRAIPVSDVSFDNDLRTLPGADDEGDGATLAAMVHLGYLSFDQDSDCARIPNREIRMQFVNMLKDSTYQTIYRKIAKADQILQDTLRGREDEIAEAFREIHHQYADPKAYNSEATLKETVDLAYYTAERFYIRMYEIPSGEGYVDMVLYPKKKADVPLLIIELKKNTAASSGLDQIRERKYPARFREYGGKEILLIGISYDADHLEKVHTCKIERMYLQ